MGSFRSFHRPGIRVLCVREYFVDTYSRVNLAPVSVVRRAEDGWSAWTVYHRPAHGAGSEGHQPP